MYLIEDLITELELLKENIDNISESEETPNEEELGNMINDLVSSLLKYYRDKVANDR